MNGNMWIVKSVFAALLAMGVTMSGWLTFERISILEQYKDAHVHQHGELQKQLGDIQRSLGQIEGKIDAYARD